jgi:hypothetical protein
MELTDFFDKLSQLDKAYWTARIERGVILLQYKGLAHTFNPITALIYSESGEYCEYRTFESQEMVLLFDGFWWRVVEIMAASTLTNCWGQRFNPGLRTKIEHNIRHLFKKERRKVRKGKLSCKSRSL